MYIPYEIGDTCYFFAENGTLARGVIKSVHIDQKTVVHIDSNDLTQSFGGTFDISRIYPTKAIGKDALLQRAVDYANQKLEDL